MDTRLRIVLGPTNTGKTCYAVERMFGYGSGMMGFPLRLLARENYDAACSKYGREHVALMTGEERLIPERARYFFCTTESMPLERRVEFLAVDEVQMAADPHRGHVFTNRVLHARGEHETLFLGSSQAGRVLFSLLPNAGRLYRERFSVLSYAGRKTLSRLPPRVAVITFSMREVYALAGVLRKMRGGAAVVLGALSPGARRAQVELFESGRVDCLVATDAIGMGLNLNLEHVAFASLSKFDGRRRRRLTGSEMAQIAGRAGRFRNNGSFGETFSSSSFSSDEIRSIEEHRFPALSCFYWRSSNLEFSSVPALLRSLRQPPPHVRLRLSTESEDLYALKVLHSSFPCVRERLVDPASIRLLWEVCRVPDFHKISPEYRFELLSRLFSSLLSGDGCLNAAWLHKESRFLSCAEGDIGILLKRINAVRFWMYVCHRPSWVPDALYWQGRFCAIESRISAALHRALSERFIDRGSTRAMSARDEREQKKNGETAMHAFVVRRSGAVLLQGRLLGTLHGFTPKLDRTCDYDEKVSLHRALVREAPLRLASLVRDCASFPHLLTLHGTKILWNRGAVGKLVCGSDLLSPRLVPLDGGLLQGTQRASLTRALTDWWRAKVGRDLSILFSLRTLAAHSTSASVRSLAYRLVRSCGCVLQGEKLCLSEKEREPFENLGIRFGRSCLFCPALQDSSSRACVLALVGALHGLEDVPSAPRSSFFFPASEDGHSQRSSSGDGNVDLWSTGHPRRKRKKERSGVHEKFRGPELLLSALGYVLMDVRQGSGVAVRSAALEQVLEGRATFGMPGFLRRFLRKRFFRILSDASGRRTLGRERKKRGQAGKNGTKSTKKRAGKRKTKSSTSGRMALARALFSVAFAGDRILQGRRYIHEWSFGEQGTLRCLVRTEVFLCSW